MSGCYYLSEERPGSAFYRKYLRATSVNVHTSIQWIASSTTLTQIFETPPVNGSIKELKYAFPLYSGVSIVNFECIINDRRIVGVVKDSHEAKKTFNQAVAKGEIVALMEQHSGAADVFLTTLGHAPAGAKVTVRLTYVSELMHDAQTNGIRLTIPTHIAPRYESYPGELLHEPVGSCETLKITVDVMMPEGTWIRGIASPSHPISVSLGALSTAISAHPNLATGSAVLNLLGNPLDKNFVLNITLNPNTGQPKAFLEEHSTHLGQRALMATLVPTFNLQEVRPEVIFIIDCSGSMERNTGLVKSALQTFLKSLPMSVIFNICYFGSSHKFLWRQSQAYTKETLAEAMRYAANIAADMGGTEIQRALEGAIATSTDDLPLELLLLTDGNIANPRQFFDSVSNHISTRVNPLRVFTLGIGDSVADASIHGLARAGKGFAQFVAADEPFEGKVVRMLNGALSPHIDEYIVEVEYEEKRDAAEDDFDMMDESSYLSSSRNLITPPRTLKGKERSPWNSRDTEVDNASMGNQDPSNIKAPKALQVPFKLRSFFHYDKPTIYVLISPELRHRVPKALVFRALSPDGPLEFKVDIQHLEQPGQLLHQLAARKSIQELEEGQGWARYMIDETGRPIKESLPASVKLFEREAAVHLGVRYQVMGKWTSFVAVDEYNSTEHNMTILYDENSPPVRRTLVAKGLSSFREHFDDSGSESEQQSARQGIYSSRYNTKGHSMARSKGGSSYGDSGRGSSIRGAATSTGGFKGVISRVSRGGWGMIRGRASPPSSQSGESSKPDPSHLGSSKTVVQWFIGRQSFDGLWRREDLCHADLGFDETEFSKKVHNLSAKVTLPRGMLSDAFATAAIIRFLQLKMQAEVEIWELVVRKAQERLRNGLAHDSMEILLTSASELVSGGTGS